MRTEAYKAQRKIYDATPRAKELSREAKKRYYLKHKDALLLKMRAYNQNTRAVRLERNKKHYIDNREMLLARKKAWRLANPEKVKELKRLDYLKHKPKRLETCRKWRDKNKLKMEEWQRGWAKRNIEKVRNSLREWKRRNPDKVVAEVNLRRAREAKVTFDDTAKQFYSWVRAQELVHCAHCGASLSGRKAHVDHVVAITRGGAHVASNMCVSCPPCNLSKNNKLISEWKPNPAKEVV